MILCHCQRSVILCFLENMSEKLCLQWNDFNENVNSAFGRLRSDKEFTDVTLACEDGQQVEAHKVILAASSPFFEKILQKNKHPHPLIYLRGFQSQDLLAILDFLYFGEANVFQESLDSFLAIAEELKLKGLTGQTSDELINEHENQPNPKPANTTKEAFVKPTAYNNSVNDELDENIQTVEPAPSKASTALANPNQFDGDLQALDEKVKSMMEKSLNMIPDGKNRNGTPRRATATICKVCGKEGRGKDIRDHIEANHLEGLSIQCDHCDITFGSRSTLGKHNLRHLKNTSH